MNVFLLGWNLEPSLVSRASAELRRMIEVYPQLDGGSSHAVTAGSLSVACAHPSDAFIHPRRYVWLGEQGGCFYDGCGVDSTGQVESHDARALYAAWDRLPESLEGQLTVVRFSIQPATLEVMTDPIGMKQVYVRRIDEGWLISNSVNLLHRIRSDSPLDPTAMSVILTTGWIAGDRTLREGIRVVPGGQIWRWTEGNAEPETTTYYSRSRLLEIGRGGGKPADVERTGRELIGLCRDLASGLGVLQCPLTGGRDSRVLAALLTHGEIPATYYTDGLPESTDVEIARELARAGGLPHSHVPKPPELILEHWETLSRRLLEQADGMASLWQLADVFEPEPIDRLRPRLWGAGGEVSRGNYYEARLLLGRASVAGVIGALHRDLVEKRGRLVRPEAKAVARRFQADFVREAVDEGFTPLDALDLFYIEQSTRRWFGSNARKVESVHDLFTPFCTRPFVEAAFMLPPRQRYTEPIHRILVRSFAPHLDRVAYEKGPWPPRSATVNGLKWLANAAMERVVGERFRGRSKRRAFDRVSWIETRREWIRSFCLDRTSSPVWDVVDRDRFDFVTATSTAADERQRYEKDLCHVLTVFAYDAL